MELPVTDCLCTSPKSQPSCDTQVTGRKLHSHYRVTQLIKFPERRAGFGRSTHMGFTGQASRRTIGTGNIAIEAHRKLCSKVSCSSFTRHSASRSVAISAIIVEAERRLDFSVYESQTDHRCDSSFEHIDSNLGAQNNHGLISMSVFHDGIERLTRRKKTPPL